MTLSSSRGWIGRALAAAGLLVLAGIGTTRSLGLALERSPADAFALAPGDARLMAARAESLVGPAASTADRMRADALATRALRRDPTSVSAAATLGMEAETRGHLQQAAAWRRYANSLSRRDLRVQLWSIEAAVAAGDYRGALRHYDEALRSKPASVDLLFPVLNGAITDPRIRGALTDLLVSRPPWARLYLIQLAGSRDHVVNAATLVRELVARRYRLAPPIVPLLVDTLVADGRFDAAWGFYAAVRPRAARERIRNGDFRVLPELSTQFDWQLINAGDVSTDIDPATGRLSFTAGPGGSGLLVKQLQLLPAGRYRLQGRAAVNEAPGPVPPYWRLVCLDGREIGRVSLPAVSVAAPFGTDLTVPAGCSAQWLEFSLEPSDGTQGVSGAVDAIQLLSR